MMNWMSLQFELALYFLGRGVVAIFLPWCGADPPARRVWIDERDWSWRGFSRRVGGQRIVTTEAMEILGGGVMIAFVALGILVRRS